MIYAGSGNTCTESLGENHFSNLTAAAGTDFMRRKSDEVRVMEDVILNDLIAVREKLYTTLKEIEDSVDTYASQGYLSLAENLRNCRSYIGLALYGSHGLDEAIRAFEACESGLSWKNGSSTGLTPSAASISKSSTNTETS